MGELKVALTPVEKMIIGLVIDVAKELPSIMTLSPMEQEALNLVIMFLQALLKE
jgi:hypothetical protein